MGSRTTQLRKGAIASAPASGSSAEPLRWARPASDQAEQVALLQSAIVESIDDAIISHDLNGRVTSWNEGAERILGYKADEMIGQPLARITPEEFRAQESWILAELEAGKSVLRLETVRLHKNGNRIPVSLNASPIKAQQQVIGGALILHDITEQKKAEHAAFQLAAIVESSEDAIFSQDLSGIIQTWNKGAEQILGFTAEETVGQSITRTIPPELWDEEQQILATLRDGKKITHFQTIRLHKDGRRLNVFVTISPIRDRQGRVIGAAKILRDITRQRLTEQDAFRLAAIVESAEDAIISKDLNGIITSWNQAAERILGYSAAEIVGQSVSRIIPQELQDEELRILAKIRAGERIDHFQTVRLHKNGDRLDVSLTISPVRDEHGKTSGAAKILRDISQQKRLEEALHTSERLAAAGRLAATIAHEINNPLESVTNFIYLAKEEPGISTEVRDYLDIADQELARVAHVAQQTLGFFRDTSQPVSFAVPGAVEDALALYDRKLKYKNITVECRLDPGLTIRAFQGEFKQVVLNLLANAIDASKEGGRVLIRSRASRHYRSGRPGIRFTVADAGNGIAETDKSRVFKPFFTTKKDVGTGLGLWITRDLLQKRGGHVRFRSRTSEPSGTVMSIYLPALVPTAEPVTLIQ